MSNKRNLKKNIKNACGNIAGECIYASFRLEDLDESSVESVVSKAVLLQITTVDKVSTKFDKTRKDFADEQSYRKARRAYFKEYYAVLYKEFADGINSLVKEMNDMLTPEQKEVNKKEAN